MAMKRIKRVFAVLLVMGIMVSMIVMPASAASVDWWDRFAVFPTLSQAKNGGTKNEYVCALQRFLGSYSTDFSNVLDEYGYPDGYFGNKTALAVEGYQQRKNLSVDRIVGPNTWRTIAAGFWDEIVFDQGVSFTKFRANGPNDPYVIIAHTYVQQNGRKYRYYEGDANPYIFAFHTDYLN